MLRIYQHRKLVNIVCQIGDGEALFVLNAPQDAWFAELYHAPHRSNALAEARRAMAKAKRMEDEHVR